MSPLASHLLTWPSLCGLAALGALAVWCWLKLCDRVRAWNRDCEIRRERQEAQVKVYARLEASEFKHYRMDDGSLLLIRVNLITPARPAKMEGQGV